MVAELATEFRSESDYLGECNKNRLLAAAECFAHAAIRRRSALKEFVLGCRDQGTLSNPCGEIYLWWNKLKSKYIFRYKRSAPKQGMVGASNFHLLGVGAEKSSLYSLALLGFDAYNLEKGEGFRKELLSPFAGLLVRGPAL